MKKHILIMLVMVLVIGALYGIREYYSNTFNVTTTNAYIASEPIEGAGYLNKYILIENTGGTYGLVFKAYGYPSLTSFYYEDFIAETTVAHSSDFAIKIANTAYAKVVIQFKWVTGATAAVVTYILIP